MAIYMWQRMQGKRSWERGCRGCPSVNTNMYWKRPFYCCRLAGNASSHPTAGSHFYFFIKPKSVGDKLILSILSVLCEEWQTLTRLPLTNFLKHISSSCTLKQLGQKSVFLYFSTAIAGKILVTAKCSITRNAAPPPGTETPVKGTVTMFQLVRC